MQIRKVIEQLGFTPKEAKVYLTALSMGECHLSDLVKEVKMPRTSVQFIVEKLHQKGFINFYIMNHHKYWVAKSPEYLLLNLKKTEEIVQESMPQLVALKRKNKNQKYLKKFEQSVNFLHVFADTSIQPILVINAEMQIEYVNSAWENELGYTLDEVYGKNPEIFKSEETSNEIYKQMWKNLNNEKLFQSDKLVDKRRDGTCFSALTTIFSVRHNGNVFFIQILENIT